MAAECSQTSRSVRVQLGRGSIGGEGTVEHPDGGLQHRSEASRRRIPADLLRVTLVQKHPPPQGSTPRLGQHRCLDGISASPKPFEGQTSQATSPQRRGAGRDHRERRGRRLDVVSGAGSLDDCSPRTAERQQRLRPGGPGPALAAVQAGKDGLHTATLSRLLEDLDEPDDRRRRVTGGSVRNGALEDIDRVSEPPTCLKHERDELRGRVRELAEMHLGTVERPAGDEHLNETLSKGHVPRMVGDRSLEQPDRRRGLPASLVHLRGEQHSTPMMAHLRDDRVELTARRLKITGGLALLGAEQPEPAVVRMLRE